MMADLVIRNGTLIDGTGGPRRQADLAIDGDCISDIGPSLPPAHAEFDASGLIVTPGWVDVHTHYDGQITWDPLLTPSSNHGVTTVVMGSCGVGFAPVRPNDRDWLIGLMEGVEDIPGAALHEGIRWAWESFPEYLDALDQLSAAMDFGTQVPHGAIRTYVMGERGARNEPATRDDIARMSRLVQEAIEAGALGFSTSRTLIHRGMDGELVPGTFAAEDELLGIARGIEAAGGGVFQMTSNHVDMADEFPWMQRIARETSCRVSFNLLQSDAAPDLWRHMLDLLDEAADEGLDIFAQVCGRPNGVLMCWEGTAVPFLNKGPYLQLHGLPLEERMDRLREPSVRAEIVAAEPFSIGPFEDAILQSFHKMYRLGDPPEYEPDPAHSAAAIAARRGCDPQEVVYDWLMENDGRGIIYFPIFNYSDGNLDVLHSLLQHPRTVLGLGDGGAHCGTICDASLPTSLLTHWARDRSRGPGLPLEQLVRMQSQDTAALFGLADRGVLAPGMRADINLIDFDSLAIHAPQMIYDLPAGGRRFTQAASGYRATIAAGQIVSRDGQPTGALPGTLMRGPQA